MLPRQSGLCGQENRQPHCRIGRVKFRNGASLHLLPDARERQTQIVLHDFAVATERIAASFGGARDFCGFAIVAWDSNSEYTCQFITNPPSALNRNTLPEFLAEAIRRDNAEWEARRVFRNS